MTAAGPLRRERILIVDDDLGLAEVIAMLLAGEGFQVEHCAGLRAAQRAIAASDVDLVVTDLRLPDGTGLEVIRAIKDAKPEIPIILMTSYSSVESAIEALRHGAIDYIIKPFDNAEFLHAVERALNERRINRENAILKRHLRNVHSSREIIGESPGIKRVLELIRKVAPADANVLIQGESGTGKELVALGLHYASHRADGPFVPINCAAIPRDLLESELFGHARGAFTGAVERSDGLIREAHGGTLLLDEISELAPALQVKLLRVLQDRVVRPVGGKQVHTVDVRFVAATNRNLKQAMEQGQFREDLYYRLNVIGIHVPPLRERGGDVDLLARHFIDFHGRRMGKRIRRLGPDLEVFLRQYTWPGNVRELENLIERAVILAESDTLTCRDFAESLPVPQAPPVAPPAEVNGHPASIEAYMRGVVERFQDVHSDTELARILGIGRKTLWMRRREWGLQRGRSAKA
jgi:DNA-binding NtrC family response regulator